MRTEFKKLKMVFLLVLALFILAVPVSATGAEAADAPAVVSTEVDTTDHTKTAKAYASALVMGLAATAGAIAMGMVISKSVEGIARQPEAEGKIRTGMMLGLVFVETAVIYALIIAILIIFVL